MNITVGTSKIDLQTAKPSAPKGHCGLIIFPLPAVGTEHQVTCQHISVTGNKCRQLGAADLLLTFKEEFDIYGQAAPSFQHGFGCKNRDEHIAFIIGSPAGVKASIDDGGFKRGPGPTFQRIDRLGVEMTVDQDGGLV